LSYSTVSQLVYEILSESNLPVVYFGYNLL